MAIYSEEVGFFDAQEADLLNEVSFDLSFALDSLDRDRAVRRVEDTIACHSSVIDSMMEAVIVSDENSSITAWNKAAEGALGWTAGEVLRRDVRTLLKPEWAGMGEEDAKGLLESTGHLKGRASFATKTGGEVTADATVDTVRDAHGRTRGVVTIIKTDADLGVGDRDG
jgi:PAS domain S-box-containing protein